MGGAEIRVIEWTSLWDDRGAMEVRDGSRGDRRYDGKAEEVSHWEEGRRERWMRDRGGVCQDGRD